MKATYKTEAQHQEWMRAHGAFDEGDLLSLADPGLTWPVLVRYQRPLRGDMASVVVISDRQNLAYACGTQLGVPTSALTLLEPTA